MNLTAGTRAKGRLDGRPGWAALGFAACWLLAELARGVLLTGFPWIAGGYAHTSGPLAAWAPWVGVYGIGALAAWLAASFAFVPRGSYKTAAVRLMMPLAVDRRNLPSIPPKAR